MVGDDAGVAGRKQGDSLWAEVVGVLVCDEDKVGLGQRSIVCRPVSELPYGVDLYLFSVVDHADAGVHEGIQLHRLSAFCGEEVALVGVGGHGFALALPGKNATFEVDDLKTVGSQDVGSFD